MIKKALLFLAGLGMTIAFLWMADTRAVWHSFKLISATQLLLLFGLQLITILLLTFQWQRMSGIFVEGASMKKIFHMNMMGTFIESITPSAKAGGEATKVCILKSEFHLSLGVATAIVALQKTLSFLAFFILSVISIFWFLLRMKTNINYKGALWGSFFLIFILLILLVALLLWPTLALRGIESLPMGEKWKKKILDSLGNFYGGIDRVKGEKRVLYSQLILSFVIWLFFPLKTYLIASYLHINLGFIPLAVVTYLTYMVGMVPIAPGGLGTIEGTMVFMLTPLGVPIHLAMALSLLLRLVTFWFVFSISGLYAGLYTLLELKKKWKVKMQI